MGRRKEWISLLGSGFFGLTSDYRAYIFSQIHEIVFHGNGGYTWADVYNMPIWLRRFTFNKLQEYFNNKQKAEEEAYNKARGTQKAKISKPDIKPSYTVKTSK